MPNDLTQADILNAVVVLSAAELSKQNHPDVKFVVRETCEALLEAGLIPVGTAPDVWRCCEDNKEQTVEALKHYLAAS